MRVLVISATKIEIGQTASFYQTSKPDDQISFLTTGVGVLETTYGLAKYLSSERPDLVIQAGIAGTFEPSLIGTVTVVKDERLADLGVWEQGNFRTVFDLSLADKNRLPYRAGLLVNPYAKLIRLTGLPPVSAISVNEISTDLSRILWMYREWQPQIESMEGAALHYVCLDKQIPFLQIRSISNQIGERDKSKWKMAQAIEALNNALMSILKKIEGSDETYFRL